MGIKVNPPLWAGGENTTEVPSAQDFFRVNPGFPRFHGLLRFFNAFEGIFKDWSTLEIITRRGDADFSPPSQPRWQFA